MKTLFVANVPFAMSENDLSNLFEMHGAVEKCSLILDRVTRHSRGFAFVDFVSDADADRALRKMNNFIVDGRRLDVKIAEPK